MLAILVSLDAAEAVLVARKWHSSGSYRIFNEPSHFCGEVGRGWLKEKRGLTSSALWLSLLLTQFGAYEYEEVSAILVLTHLITFKAATIIAIFI